MEFAEVRPYQPGDDVRTIDWNVTARMGHPFVKQYVEERDLTVFLAVDVSGSLGFGSRAILKRELAAEIAALLAFAALRNQDRVGAALLSRPARALPAAAAPAQPRAAPGARDPRTGRRTAATDLESGPRAPRSPASSARSVLFLISDFVQAPCERALKAAAARHDVIVIEMSIRATSSCPAVGPVVLRDAETGELALVSGKKLAPRHAEVRRRERGRAAPAHPAARRRPSRAAHRPARISPPWSASSTSGAGGCGDEGGPAASSFRRSCAARSHAVRGKCRDAARRGGARRDHGRRSGAGHSRSRSRDRRARRRAALSRLGQDLGRGRDRGGRTAAAQRGRRRGGRCGRR